MTGLISVSVRTRSPCAAVPLSAVGDLNAAQLPRAKPGFTFTAPTVTFRSVRGNATRYTSPGIACAGLADRLVDGCGVEPCRLRCRRLCGECGEKNERYEMRREITLRMISV